jgi:hypothetical protein
MATDKGLTLSPSHGLNPTMGVCYFCGKPDGTIGLLGKLPGDREAPREAILSTEPCAGCRGLMDQGIMFIAAIPTDDPTEEPHRTGPVCVIKTDAVKRLGINPQLLERILKHRWTFIDPQTWEMIGLPMDNLGGES